MLKITTDKKTFFAWVSVKEKSSDKLSVLLSYNETAELCKDRELDNGIPVNERCELPGAIIIDFPEKFTDGREGFRKAIHNSIVGYMDKLEIKELSKIEIIL